MYNLNCKYRFSGWEKLSPIFVKQITYSGQNTRVKTENGIWAKTLDNRK